MLKKIAFQPGVNKEGTQFSSGYGWYDADRVRFRMGRPEQIGGWEKYSAESFKGIARSLFDWKTAGAFAYIGIGTNKKFYVESGQSYYDITPLRNTTAAGEVTFSAVAGDATITVTDNLHGAAVGDFVTFSGAVTLGGNITAEVLNKEYAIATIIDGDQYTIEATDGAGDPVLANASDTGNGGSSVVGEYQISIGINTYVPSSGYGTGAWGEEPWGGSSDIAYEGQLRLYSQDVFGNDLIFNPRGGAIYFWDESVGTGDRAVAIEDMPGAKSPPELALQIMVSDRDRHVIAFGATPLGSQDIDPLLVRWSDQESAIDWLPTAINSSGGQVLSSGTVIVGAIKTRQEILVFTDTNIHSMRYSGAPFIYNFSVVAENISVVGPKAATTIGDAVYFMDMKGFYVYEGAVRRIPCTVLNYVFANIDRGQLYKVHAAKNTDNSEVTWFYPAGTADTEINSYVTYNYMEQTWTVGTLERGAWIPADSRSYPIAASADTVNIDTQYLYNHEKGHDADGSEMNAYIESGEVSIEDGNQFAFIRRVLPDFRFDGTTANADITMTIKGTDFPLDAPVTLVTKTIAEDTKQLHVRARAREIVLRLDANGIGYGWTMGDFRLDLRTDGKR